MKVKTLGYFFAVMLAMSGCANVSTMKINSSQIEGRNVAIIPTGAAKIEGLSSTVGGAFGALGVLIEHAATEASRAKSANQVAEAFTIDDAFSVATNQISKNGIRLGAVKRFVVLQRSLPSEEFTSWYNSDQRSDSRQYGSTGAEFVIDVGFQSLTINSYLAGRYAEAALGVRVIEVSSGKVVGRARTFGVGAFGGEKIEVDSTDPQYGRAVAASFTKIIQRLTDEAITKIAER